MGASTVEPSGTTVGLVGLIIVGSLLSVQCANQPANATAPRPATPGAAQPAPQLCLPARTPASDRFALVHGCITYNDGTEIWAVDPNHPSNRISLGPSSS